jgi:tetratricopeptide (TPR) repeat protein
MKSSCVTAVLVLVFGFQEWSFSQEHADKARCESAQLAVIVEEEPQLFENMGPYRRKFTTDSEAAQEYLNQGMVWIQAFNHDEARRSFLKAAELDPKCAWAWWGVAYCEGPNYNDPKPDGNRSRAAWYALQNALARISNASDVERDLILALKSRYSNPWPADRSGLENNYADAPRFTCVERSKKTPVFSPARFPRRPSFLNPGFALLGCRAWACVSWCRVSCSSSSRRASSATHNQ